MPSPTAAPGRRPTTRLLPFLHSVNPCGRNVERRPTGRAGLGCSVVGFQARSRSDPRVFSLQRASPACTQKPSGSAWLNQLAATTANS